MVALLVGLKWRLLLSGLTADTWQVIGLVLAAVAGFTIAAAAMAILVAVRFTPDPTVAAQAVTVGGALLLLGWMLVPLLVFGVDETLDPARFALLPLRGPQLVPGLAVAALVGVPGVSTALVALTTIVTWTRGLAPFAVAVLAAPIGLGTCIVTSRLLTTAGARVLTTRRSREISTVLGVLLISSIGLLPLLITTQLGRAPDIASFVDLLGWTPLGWAWAAPGDAATGHLGRGLTRLLLATVMLVAAGAGWGSLLGRALVNQPGGGSSATGARGETRRRQWSAALLDRLPATPTWAVAVRCLRYWRRDPRYIATFSSLVIAVTVPVVAIRLGAPAAAGPSALRVLLGIGPFVGLLVGLSASNDLGYDASAFAAHLLSGLAGRADRAGRLIALLIWSTPVVVVAALLSCRLSDSPRLAPGMIGLSLAALLGSVSASSVGGALAPYPMPEAGANPFRSNAGGSARVLLAQAVSAAMALAVAAPSGITLVFGALGWTPGLWIALVVGPAVGVGVLVAAVHIGGAIVDRRGPEILAAVRRSQ